MEWLPVLSAVAVKFAKLVFPGKVTDPIATPLSISVTVPFAAELKLLVV